MAEHKIAESRKGKTVVSMSDYKIDYCHHDSVTAESRQDYIKREDVLALKGNCYDKDGHLLYAVGTGDIMRVPTADVAEVVRCKDCKHHEELLYNNDGKVLCWVHGLDVIVDRNGYCNYGERKEQDNETSE